MPAALTLRALASAVIRSSMSQHHHNTTHTLSLAEKQTLAFTLTCIGARKEAVAAQNRSFAAYRSLRDLRDEAKRAPQGDDFSTAMLMMLLNETLVAEAHAVQLSDVARNSSVMLLFHEKQLQHSRKEEAEAKFARDQMTEAATQRSSSPRDIQAEYTNSPHGIWRKQVDKAYADYSQMRVLPSPPALTDQQTHSLSCKDRPKPRPIDACECAVRRAFLGHSPEPVCSGTITDIRVINLRTERLRWAPENFTQCPARLRAQAAYVFRIIDTMYNSIPR